MLRILSEIRSLGRRNLRLDSPEVMEGGVTIHLPVVPLVELVLVAIAVLLWRILLVIHDGVKLLRVMQVDAKTKG